MPLVPIDKNLVREMYIDQDMTLEQVALELNVSVSRAHRIIRDERLIKKLHRIKR